MTEPASQPFRDAKALARLKKRRAADRRFRLYGLAAIGVAMAALLLLVFAIGSRAISAATYHTISFDLALDVDEIAPKGSAAPAKIARNVDGFFNAVMDNLDETFPDASEDRRKRQELSQMITRLAVLPIAENVARHPERVGTVVNVTAPLNDNLDLYLKGAIAPEIRLTLGKISDVTIGEDGGVVIEGNGAFDKVVSAIAVERADYGDEVDARSMLVQSGVNVGRIRDVTEARATLEVLSGTAEGFVDTQPRFRMIELPEVDRNVSDQQIAWTLALKEQGRIKRVPHASLLTHTDSTYPELAGALAAIVGSLMTMMVTAFLAVPVGILASVYLEEFAPKNRLTDMIEVNINNLAAVPSIVFGLLGSAVFLGFFSMPRSAPLVGGLVLALLILPVVIIASRAALKSVPPSIRSAALGVGASKMQTVFHHVVPLAAPGMLTGAILGMARALGETAPLLLIGMVAFVASVPTSPADEATALPVLIYRWASLAERSLEPMTAAVIVVLLTFLIIMNGAVVLLRRKFERRW